MKSRPLGFSLLACAALAVSASSLAAQDYASVIASMREDIRILDERTRSLTAEIEQLKRENRALREQVSSNPQYVTLAQLNSSLAELERSLRAGDKEVAVQMSQQLERLAKQTQAAIDTLAKSAGARASAPQFEFTPLAPNTPGVTYEVQRGDTLDSIARRFNSSVRDIQNANKIADPKTLQAGQTLFIPQKQ